MQTEHGPPDNTVEPLIVIASNRGPYSFRRKDDGTFSTQRGEGGLVTALAALAANNDVLWIAAALNKDDAAWTRAHDGGTVELEDIRLRMLIPNRRRYRMYYNQIANPLLWFIQHQMWDGIREPIITADTWRAWEEGYVAINRQFADTIIAAIPDTDQPILIFPQDYHLYLLPEMLRAHFGGRVQIQPFIHIPWPGPDVWQMLPQGMRTPLLCGLLASDRIGFQTERDAFNFVQTCRFYLPDAHAYGSRTTLAHRGRTIEARAYPISIDVEKVEALRDETSTRLHKHQLLQSIGVNRLILRIDRIEPSKNILRGLLAFRTLLETHPEYRGKVQMLGLLVPSRLEVEHYRDYLSSVMAEAGMINATYSDELWEPTRLIIGSNYARAIAALELYDVLLVNPINDGMNLVAKEGALINERGGVLVLSENAGAVFELGAHALTISPYDVHNTAEALHQALSMPRDERFRHADALREQVKGSTVQTWFQRQVHEALIAWERSVSQSATPSTPTTSVSADASTEAGVSPSAAVTPMA